MTASAQITINLGNNATNNTVTTASNDTPGLQECLHGVFFEEENEDAR